MSNTKETPVILLQWVLAIALGALMAFLVLRNLAGQQRPLSNADIPQSTIDWFNGLIDGGSDIGGILGPDERDSTEWSQYQDIDDMHRIEDSLFVVFYSDKDSLVEKNKAQICLRYAHQAVPMGEKLMKKYPYPRTMGGRKLPIYLAKTVDDFRSICDQLGHGDPGTWAIGLYCFQYSFNGVYTDGIIISPQAWSLSDKNVTPTSNDVDFCQTLWHEMNHFIYFTNWNYMQASEPNLWFTEGLAEYFAGNYDRLREVGNYRKLNLADDFRGGGNTEYWAGLSAYLSLEKNYSISTVSTVVVNSYKNSINESLTMAIPNYDGVSEWNLQWHQFMDNKEYQKYKE